MSFGFSPSDVISIIAIAAKAYRGWNNACGEYSDITLSLNEIRILLERIKDESQSDGSVLVRSVRDANRLKGILAGVRRTAEELTNTIERFKSLGQDRSRESNWRRLQKNWDRYRFGSANVGGVRVTLSQHVAAITAYLEAVGLSSLSRIEQDLHALPELMQKSMNTLAAEIRAGRREGSTMTAYDGDDSHVWRQFRRELIGDGIRGSDIHKFKPRIKRCLQHWMEEGLLEEEEPAPQVQEDSGGESNLSEVSAEVTDNDLDSAASTQGSEATGTREAAVVQDHSSSTSTWTATEDGTIFPPHDGPVTSAATPHRSDPQTRNRDVALSNASVVQDYVVSPENMEFGDTDNGVANDTSNECIEEDVVEAECKNPLHMRLSKAKNSFDKPVLITIIVVVPYGDLRLFSQLAINARPLIPFLVRWLPETAMFRSSVVMGAETLVRDGTKTTVSMSDLEARSQSLGSLHGARIILSPDRPLFRDFRRVRSVSTPSDETDDNKHVSIDWLLRRMGNGWHHDKENFRRGRETYKMKDTSNWKRHLEEYTLKNFEIISVRMSGSSEYFSWKWKTTKEEDFEERLRERLREAAPKTGYAQLADKQQDMVNLVLLSMVRMGSEYGFGYHLVDIERANEGNPDPAGYEIIQLILERFINVSSTNRH